MDRTRHFSRLPGGRYNARQSPDGTWDVLDVPVFSVVPKGIKGAPKDITEEDLRASVQTHARLYRDDKHLARTNVLHNFGPHRPTPAGFFLPRSVRPLRMKGRTQPVVFADLIGVPDAVFREMDADGLPYCSAEVRTYEPLQFGALALLDTEPPFFEFPLITIGAREETTRFEPESAPLMAAVGCSEGAAYMFRFSEEASMPDDEKTEKDEGQMEAGEGDALDVKAIVKAIESGEISLNDMEAIVAAVESRTTAEPEAETEEELKPDGPVEMAADEEEDDEPKKKPEFSADSVKAEARIAALESFRAGVEKEKVTKALFDASAKALESEGFHLPDASRTRLFTAAQKGEEVMTLFMAEFRDIAQKDPPSDLEGLEPSEEAWPSEVMVFSAQGPEMFTAAKSEFREWQRLKESKTFGAGVSPLDKYLARNVRKEA